MGGGGALRHATCDRRYNYYNMKIIQIGTTTKKEKRRKPVKLIFEGSRALLLNNNSRELVPITNCSGCK